MNYLELLEQIFVGFACAMWLLKKAVEHFKQRRNKSKQHQEYARTSINDTTHRQKIYKMLWEDLAKYNPEGRIIVLQYHNGGKFYTGKDIQRMTLTCEVKHPDLNSIKHEYQGVVIGEEFGMNEQLLFGEVYHPNIDDVTDVGVKAIMQHHNLTAFFAIMHKNAYGLPLASVIYCFNKKINPLSDGEQDAIKRKCNTIFNFLANIQDKRVTASND